MINSETTVPTPRALAGAGPPPQTAALHHTQNPGCPRAASPEEGGTPTPSPAPSPKAASLPPHTPHTHTRRQLCTPCDLCTQALAAGP